MLDAALAPVDNLQDLFLKNLVENQSDVSVFLINGIRLQGIITAFDMYIVFMLNKQWGDTVAQMVFKRSISTIMKN